MDDEPFALLREATQAKERGVNFDIGVGGKNFSFDAAKRVLDGGLIPDTISSDVTLTSRFAGTSFSQVDCIGKVMSLGITLEDALVMSTRKPAAILGAEIERELGCLAPGTHADLTMLRVHTGRWQFIDGDNQINTRRITPSNPYHASGPGRSCLLTTDLDPADGCPITA